MLSSFELLGFTDEPNIFVIGENGQNVFHQDAVDYDLSRTTKNELFKVLVGLARALRTDGRKAFDDFVAKRLVRRIEKQKSVQKWSVWEMRNDAHGGRVFFVFARPDLIIVSAVNKAHHSQKNAINRGMKRWNQLLKNLEKKD